MVRARGSLGSNRITLGTTGISKNIKFYLLPHIKLKYKGGILQRLDTDVHSAVTVKTSTAL